MPNLTTPDGAPVDTAPPAPPAAAADPDEVNRQFSRAMATDDPGGTQPPPRRPEGAEGDQPRRRGRPRKNPDDKSRVTDKPAQTPAAKVDKDFTEQCAGLATLGWAALAATPYTSAYATVVEANADQLVTALNAGCQNNAAIRQTVERWSAGGGGVWALQLAAVGTNMAVQTMQLLKDPALRAESRTHTEGKFREFLKAQGVKLPEPAQAAEAADATAAA